MSEPAIDDLHQVTHKYSSDIESISDDQLLATIAETDIKSNTSNEFNKSGYKRKFDGVVENPVSKVSAIVLKIFQKLIVVSKITVYNFYIFTHKINKAENWCQS